MFLLYLNNLINFESKIIQKHFSDEAMCRLEEWHFDILPTQSHPSEHFPGFK